MRLRARTSTEYVSPDEEPVEGLLEGGAGRRGLAWKLLAAWLIVPPLLLIMGELGLRMAGYGVSTQLFNLRELNGNTVCMSNSMFFQQFYTARFQRGVDEFCMPVPKPPNTYRIFVFGSSAAQGHPAPDFAFWRILGTMLRAQARGMRTEIYSLAMAGSNSHVMRAAAKACAAHQPDLFLVYMGNNELNSCMTQNLVWDSLPPRLALRCLHLATALNDSRLFQWFRDLPDRDNAPPRREGPAKSLDAKRIHQYYRTNVNDICRFARAAGAQVLLCTVGTRLREMVPEGNHRAGLDAGTAQLWNDACDAGKNLSAQGQFQAALAAYARAESIDSSHAGTAYGMACCHYALGEYADARREFVRARDLDARNFCAKSITNNILREIAGAHARDGVHLVDTVKALADASPHGIEGPELFLDHVHLSFEGNYVLALTVLKALAQIVPFLLTDAPPMSSEECRQRLAMAPPDMRTLLAFQVEYGSTLTLEKTDSLKQEIAQLDGEIGSRADEMRREAWRKAARTDPGNEEVRVKSAGQARDPVAALEEARALVADFPYSWKALRMLAGVCALNGDSKSAIEKASQLLSLRPDDPEMYMDLGRYLCGDDQLERALPAFEKAFTLGGSPQAQFEIARVLHKRGDAPGAVQACRRSLELAPGDPLVFEELITALCDANLPAEAGNEMRRWREATSGKDGASAAVAENAEPRREAPQETFESGAVETRLSVLRRLVQMLPPDPSTSCRCQTYLAAEAARLETAGDLKGAADACRAAIPLNPGNNQPVLLLNKILSKSSLAERLSVLESVWKENPRIPLAASYCGSARAATGDVAGAKKAFSAAQSLAPEEWSHWVVAGDALAAAGAPDDAIAAYERALALNPKLDYMHGRINAIRENAARAAPPRAAEPSSAAQ